MLLFDRRSFLTAFGLAGLAGCGFAPVYGTGTAAATLRNDLTIGIAPGRYNFELREKLLERFGQPSDGAGYDLKFDLSISSSELAISSDAQIDRYNLTGIASYRIIDQSNGLVVFSDSVKSFTAYSASAATYPTQVAQRDAKIRLVQSLGDLMVKRISSTAGGWKK